MDLGTRLAIYSGIVMCDKITSSHYYATIVSLVPRPRAGYEASYIANSGIFCRM